MAERNSASASSLHGMLLGIPGMAGRCAAGWFMVSLQTISAVAVRVRVSPGFYVAPGSARERHAPGTGRGVHHRRDAA